MAAHYSPRTPQANLTVGHAPQSRIPSSSNRKSSSVTMSTASPGSTSVSSNGSTNTSGNGTGIPTFRSLRSLLPFGPNKQSTPISASVSPNGPSPHNVSHGSGIKSSFATFGVRRSINMQRERKSSLSNASNKQIARDSEELPVISIGHGGEEQYTGTPIRKSMSLTTFEKPLPAEPGGRNSNDTIPFPSDSRARSVDSRREVEPTSRDHFESQPPILPPPPSTSPLTLPIDLSTIIEADSSGISKHLPSASTSATESSFPSLPASRYPSTSPSASPTTKFLQPPPSIPSTPHSPFSPHSPALSDGTENDNSQLDLSTTHIKVQVLDAIERAGRRASGGIAGTTAGDWLKDANARIVDADVDPDASFVIDEDSIAMDSHPILDENEVEDKDISFDLDADAIDPALAALLSPNRFPSSSTSATILAPTPTVARTKTVGVAATENGLLKPPLIPSSTLESQSSTPGSDIAVPTLFNKRPYQSSLPRLRPIGRAATATTPSSPGPSSSPNIALSVTASPSSEIGTSPNANMLESPSKSNSPHPSPTHSNASSAYIASVRRTTPGTAPPSPLSSVFLPPASASSSEAGSSKRSLSISLGRRNGQGIGTGTTTGASNVTGLSVRQPRSELTRTLTSPGTSSPSGTSSTAAGSPSRLDPAIVLQSHRAKTRVGHELGEGLGLGRPSSAGSGLNGVPASTGRRPSGEYERSSTGLGGTRNAFVLARQRKRSMSMEERGLLSSATGRSTYTRRLGASSRIREREGVSGSVDFHNERDVGDGSRPGSSLGGRPPVAEWIGPRTAKAFRAAGLLDFDNSTPASPSSGSGADVGSISGHLGRFGSLRSTATGSGSGAASEYGGSSVSRGYSRAGSRLAFSEAGGPISAPLAGGLSRSTSRRGSTSFVYPQQQSPTSAMESPTFTLSSRDRETPTRSASTAPTSVSGYSMARDRDRDWDGEAHRDTRDRERERDREELSNMKERHLTETAALLSALSDSQRTSRVLREENTELRERLLEADGELNRLGAEVQNLRVALEGEIEKTVKLEEQLADSKGLLGENDRLKRLVGDLRVQVRMKALGLGERNTGRSGADAMSATMGRYAGHQLMVPSSLSRSASASPSFDVDNDSDGAVFLGDGPMDQNMAMGGAGKNSRVFAATSTPAALRTVTQSQGRHFPSEQRMPTSHSRRPSASSSSSVFPVLPPNMTMLMHEDSMGFGSGASGTGSPRQIRSHSASPSHSHHNRYSLTHDDDSGDLSGSPSSPTVAIPLGTTGPSRHRLNKSITSSHHSLSPTTPSFSLMNGSPESLLFMRPEHERHLGDLEPLDLELELGRDEEADEENFLDS